MAETNIMLVRLNLGEDPDDNETWILPDDALSAWLEKFDQNTDRVTHRALLTIAMSEVLTSKVIRSQDLQTNGAAVSAELRELAETYKQAADDSDGDNYFAGYVPPPSSPRREAEELRYF